MKRFFFLYYLLTIVFVLLVSGTYEFWIESSFSFLQSGDDTTHHTETTAEHWEYVLTVTLFSAVALLAPIITAYTIESKRLRAEEEKLLLQQRLDETLTKLLSGFVGICSICKKVRVEDRVLKSECWNDLDSYVAERTDLMFSHGYCPECAARLRQEIGKPIEQ